MAKADTDAPARKRVGDYNPDIPTGLVLDSIANTDVEIAGVTFHRRKGKNGFYVMSVITLTDGSLYHTGSPVVTERLAAPFGLSDEEFDAIVERGEQPAPPSGAFPITAKFTREQSKSNPSQSYWTVS